MIFRIQQKKTGESKSSSDTTKSTDDKKDDSSTNVAANSTSTSDKSSTSPTKKVDSDVKRSTSDVKRPALLECPHCDELKGNEDAPNLRLHIFHHYKEHWLERVSPFYHRLVITIS